MWNRANIKQCARTAFQRNYWNAVAVAAIFYFLDSVQIQKRVEKFWQKEPWSETVRHIRHGFIVDFFELLFLIAAAIIVFLLAAAVKSFLTNVVEIGINRFFLENRNKKAELKKIGYGFRKEHYLNTVWVQFLRMLFTAFWMLLLIIPGIIKSYEYRMIPYILAENPQISRKRAFLLSKQMMNGQKMEVFILDLSFIGWAIASALTCGMVGWFFLYPYQEATMAELYSVLRMNAIERGYVINGELPGFE